jgi:hypothetical protein
VTEGAKKQDRVAEGINIRFAAWIAWSLAALSVAMFVAGGMLYVLAHPVQFPVIWGLFLAFPIVGALVASRRPENPIGWICLASSLLLMLFAVTDNYSDYGVARPGSSRSNVSAIARRACTKVQAENRPPARCVSPLPAL